MEKEHCVDNYGGAVGGVWGDLKQRSGGVLQDEGL